MCDFGFVVSSPDFAERDSVGQLLSSWYQLAQIIFASCSMRSFALQAVVMFPLGSLTEFVKRCGG